MGPTRSHCNELGDLVVAKTIPAGSYLVSAKTIMGANEAKTAIFVGVICEIVDSPGTPQLVEFNKALDLGEWAGRLTEGESKKFEGVTNVALQAQLTTTQATTVALDCVPIEGSKEANFETFASQISALQTTANK